ncbi:hypothetical protein ACFLUU_05830 [Chloroflexota bacterium]
MKILNGKLWVGFLIPVAMTVAGVVGGLEWAFASLGAMVLIGTAGISIYILVKALQRLDICFMGGCPKCDSMSAVSFDSDGLKEAELITKEDGIIIMEHVNELFAIGQQRSQEKPAEARPISKADKRLLMAHVDEFFAKGLEQSRGMLS